MTKQSCTVPGGPKIGQISNRINLVSSSRVDFGRCQIITCTTSDDFGGGTIIPKNGGRLSFRIAELSEVE
jgi:hypothetical protein